jgi:sugar diacid utilization regulator
MTLPTLPFDVLGTLVELGTELAAEEVDLPRVLDLATRSAVRLVGTDIAWLSLVDEPTGAMRVAVAHGAAGAAFAEMRVARGEGLGGAALAQGGPLVVSDYPAWAPHGPVRDAMLAEGVASVICAPMIRQDEIVGVLYAANRRPTDFAPADEALVAALAVQASVAIANARLYRTLLDRTATLEATFDIHRALGDAAVSGAGIDRVVRALGELTGRQLLLEQEIVAPHTLRQGPSVADAPTDRITTTMPIRRHGTDLGRLTVYGDAPLSVLERNAFSHGTTVLALELMRHEAARDVELRLRGELLEQLLEAPDESGAELAARAARFGLTLGEPCAVLVVESEGPFRRPRVPRDPGVLCGRRGDRFVVALLGEGHDVAAHAERLLRPDLPRFPDDQRGETPTWVGTSVGRTSIAAGFREAAACAALARRASPRRSRALHSGALGSLRFMLDIADLTNAHAFVETMLGPVAAYEEAGGARLLTTLRAYVEEDGHLQRIATRCHVHVSTAKYRLARIGELLDRPLRHWETRFDLALAFRLADLLADSEVKER